MNDIAEKKINGGWEVLKKSVFPDRNKKAPAPRNHGLTSSQIQEGLENPELLNVMKQFLKNGEITGFSQSKIPPNELESRFKKWSDAVQFLQDVGFIPPNRKID